MTIENIVSERIKHNIECLTLTYKDAINDFNSEWSKKKFKWFFKRYRQNKLMKEIVYRQPLYYITEITQPNIEENTK
jgi:hypothetical protein